MAESYSRKSGFAAAHDAPVPYLHRIRKYYEALGYGRSVQAAFDLALVQLTDAGADRSLAKLYKRRGIKPAELVLVNPPRPQ